MHLNLQSAIINHTYTGPKDLVFDVEQSNNVTQAGFGGKPIFNKQVFAQLENAGFYGSIVVWNISLSSERMTFA
jgi:hypothetical protein